MEMLITKEQLLELLKNSVIRVTFTKVNGEEREMEATLLAEYLPHNERKQTLLQEGSKDVDDSQQIRVWDREAGGWRSFRFDSIKKIRSA